jgi:hypothetical protein
MVNDVYGGGASPFEPRHPAQGPRTVIQSRILIEQPRPDGGVDYVELDDWIGGADAALAALQAHAGRVDAQISTLAAQRSEPPPREEHRSRGAAAAVAEAWRRSVEEALRSLTAQMNTLSHRFNEILERLDSLSASAAAQSSGASQRQTQEGIAHHTYVEEYQVIRDSTVRGLLQHTRSRDGRELNGRERAQFTARLCDDLFGADHVSANQILNRLAAHYEVADAERRIPALCEEVRALRDKVSRGRPHRWQFTCDLGAPVNPNWQEEWPHARQGGVIEFVVAPAYVVDDGAVLVPQLVFTARAEPAPAPDPLPWTSSVTMYPDAGVVPAQSQPPLQDAEAEHADADPAAAPGPMDQPPPDAQA